MAFIIDRADTVASLLEMFTNSNPYQVAGQYANIEFWTTETLHCLGALTDYDSRFERMSTAQREWITAHKVVVDSYCSMCGGQCEFDPELRPPETPTRIPSKGRTDANRRLKDAYYFFILRCFRMNLIDEPSLRDICARVGTSVEARDLVRK